jgi:membrane protein DedA with SNARE-associated domain
MSIASHCSKVESRRYYWIDKVSKIFFRLVMLYPVVFLIAVLCYKFLDWEVIHGLLGYVIVLLVLFLTWNILDRSKK